MKPWIAARQIRQNRSEMGRTECEGHCDTQAAGKITGRLDRFPGRIDLRAHSCRMVAKRNPRFGQRRAARGSGKKLDAKLRLEPEKATADHRLGHAKPTRGSRYASGIGHFHKYPQIVSVHPAFPVSLRSVTGARSSVPPKAMPLYKFQAVWRHAFALLAPSPSCRTNSSLVPAKAQEGSKNGTNQADAAPQSLRR